MALKTSRGRRQLINHDQLRHVIVVLILMFASAVLFLIDSGRTSASQDQLRVWFFDVGQGDAIFIEAPGGEQLLIDGGPDADVLTKLGSVMWPFDRQIDAIIATHPDADHIGGLVSVLARYDIDRVYEPGVRKQTGIDASFVRAIQHEGADYYAVRSGDVITLGALSLVVMWPPNTPSEDINDQSIVVLLRHGETTLLLTGDISKEIEQVIATTIGDIDVLKVAHHGSASSSHPAFLDAVDPEIAIIQAGEKNRYGHPHPIVIDRLEERGVRIYRTDLDGDIMLMSDGGEPWVRPKPLPY